MRDLRQLESPFGDSGEPLTFLPTSQYSSDPTDPSASRSLFLSLDVPSSNAGKFRGE